MIGYRLRIARAAAGMSLRGLSSEIEGLVSAQAIGKYERNEDMPRSAVLLAMADALDISVEYLLKGDELVLGGVEFRKEPKTSSRENATIVASSIHLLERYLVIEELLNLKSIDWEVPRRAPHPVFHIHDAEDAARSVREDWDLGNDPIPQLAELLEERGIKVLSLTLRNIDGLTAQARRRNRSAAQVIIVNRDAWSERKRFAMARELGHLVINPAPEMSDQEIEKAAHRFAGAFLVPADTLRVEMGSNRSSVSIGELVALKDRFGVSIQAIAYRCRDLGILNQRAVAKLFRLLNQHGWRKPPYVEPKTIPPEREEPKRFERLCYRALSENVIGEPRAAELLGITVRELAVRFGNSVN